MQCHLDTKYSKKTHNQPIGLFNYIKETQNLTLGKKRLTAALEASSLRLCPCFLTLALCSRRPQLYKASVYAAKARLKIRKV